MCCSSTDSRLVRDQLPLRSQPGIVESVHQDSVWPNTCCPCSSANATIASATVKSNCPRCGCRSAIFIAVSAVIES